MSDDRSQTKHWLVGSAIVRDHDGAAVLLVHNRRRGDRYDWSTPGGVIDRGERVVDGIAREVEEETGLRIVDWSHLAYTVMVEAVDLGWSLGVEVWEANTANGDLNFADDPDGIVIDARFCTYEHAADLLAGAPRWVCEPLSHHLYPNQTEPRPTTYRYDVRGSQLSALVVERLE